MPHVQPEASVVQTGLGLRYIGEHCYAYSGDFASDAGNATSYLEFKSGNGYIVGTMQFHYGVDNDDNYSYDIKFNALKVVHYYTAGGREGEPRNVIPLLIPPFTEVLVRCQNISSSTGRRQNVSFVGRVYGAE